MAEQYDRRHFGGKSGRHILRQDCEAIAGILPPPPGRVLDIPCGTGIYAEQLIGLGYRVFVTDASGAMLQLTAQRLDGAEPGVCGIHELPFRDDFFDATLTLRLFSHFDTDEIVRGLRELCRVIKPGGRVIFDTFRWTPRRWPVLRRLIAQSFIYESAPCEVETMIHESGLHKVESETRYLFSPIWQRKLPYPCLRVLSAAEGMLPGHWLLRTFWACTKDT